MSNKNQILDAISTYDRKNKVYVHPILTPDMAAKYISAFANGSGGDIVLGVKDDGLNLKVKKYSFQIKIQFQKALELLNREVDFVLDSIEYNGVNLPFISISKSEHLVKASNKPYKFTNQGELIEMKINKVFLSYAHDDSDLADIIETSLNKSYDIDVTRDVRVVDFGEDLEEFMRTIRKHDYVLSVVTKSYLESVNCMYEITQAMKDENFKERLLFIVVDSKKDLVFYKEEKDPEDINSQVYDADKRFDYTIKWNTKIKGMNEKLRDANIPAQLTTEYTLSIRKLDSIVVSSNEFMELVSRKLGDSFYKMQEDDFKIFRDRIRNN
ncbi:TIR domain-containing protein [Shouchella miscanthi]|uniref:TIR domain-containing protein n=1 Tax=Shouchella miscanthi TaxID=2598861 RepID=UPI0011A5040E|nr:TIR domain-containing protein [Shouchella miscanthi]